MNSPYKGKFRVSQPYKGYDHKGIDLVGVDSKDIYSAVNGIVERAGRDTNPNDPNNTRYGMGNYIRIKDDATGYVFYFAHLSRILVKTGQRVKVGDKIGVEGNTGHSFGSHLHYEMRKIPNNTTYQDISKHIGIPNKIGQYIQEEEEEVQKYNTVAEAPDWSRETLKKLIAKGVLKGDANSNLDLTLEMIRLLVMLDRAKLF